MSLLPAQRPILLELDLTEPLVESSAADPLTRLRHRGRRQLRPTLRALREAGDDPRVVGLVARIGPGSSWSTMQEIQAGVQSFRDSGKPTFAWAESLEGSGSLAAYTLASSFGELWLQPGGSLGPLGVGIETTFLRGALDKLGVTPEFERRHEYKNAVDRFSATELSDPHRESLDAIAASLFDRSVTSIARARGLDVDDLRALIDAGPLTAGEALNARLVDRLGYRDEVLDRARRSAGPEPELLYADLWQTSDPVRRVTGSLRRRLAAHRGHVALVEVTGAITAGRSKRQVTGQGAGSDSICAALRAAAADEHARALVLRIDSPGGSAVASETIWREVVRLQEDGVPVVVSMGSVAASGGYFVAAPAEVIVALPATLTGSIGVFGGKFVTAGLSTKLGLSVGTVERGQQVLMNSAQRSFSEAERARLAVLIDAIYDDFVAKVAQGRGRSIEEVEPLARGRVWTGADALEIGLVDQLGGFADAVRIARERGGLPTDAPLVRAGHPGALPRLRPARSSADPAASARIGTLGGLTDGLLVENGPADWLDRGRTALRTDRMLQMPAVHLV